MLASIPVNEMADTLRVLAGDNAANAARHFTKRSYDMGDVSAAVLWSSIVQVLGEAPPAAAEAEAAPADPAPLAHIREGMAFQGVRYEDVDPETLARNEPSPIVAQATNESVDRAPKRFAFAPSVRTFGRSERRSPDAREFALAQAA